MVKTFIIYYFISFAGKSRSTSFIVAFLMFDRGMSMKDALILARSKRPIADPNPGFLIQLKAFEKVIFGKVSDVPIVFSKKSESEEIPKEIQDGI